MRLASRLCAILVAGLLSAAVLGCGEDDEPSAPAADTTATESTSTTTTSSTESSTSTTTDETGLPKERCAGAESPPNITEVISYGTDCGAVEDAMAEIRSVSTEFRIGDFQCERTSGSELSGTWECRGEASYFTFVFAD